MRYHRRHKRPSRPQSRYGFLLPPLLSLLGLGAVAGLVALISLQLAGRNPPAVLRDAAALHDPAGAHEPFSLTALHRRLTREGLEQVGRYIDYYRDSRRRGIEGALARSTRYMEGFRRIFRRAGLPEDLAYLPLIESGYVETAVSPAKAVGIWQFTEETGRRFNLQSNPWFDKRRDPMTSARAAALYLKQLYRTFNDWDLALAAYNSGAGTVRWAMRVNRKAGKPTSYWMLEELPDETRNYVPAFIAAVLIARNLDAFGFGKIRFMPRLVFERMKVAPGISLTFLAEHLEIDEQSLFELNPELLRREIPPGDSVYLLRIPPGTRRLVRVKLAGEGKAPRDWVLHQVGATDTLQALGSRFQATPARIMQVNGIQDNQDLTRRKLVIIPL
jgi:membrane-bound lytic murein transglycosylase D